MVYTETNRKSIMKWCKEHPEEWKRIHDKAVKAYYERNREQILAKKKAQREEKKRIAVLA